MIKKQASVISDFGGGQDTRTPILYMPMSKSPNMRNWHCAGIKERLIKRGGFAKVNSSTVETDGLDVYYPPGYQTTDHALRDTAANTQISQGFKCNTSSTVIKVKLWLKKTGTPAGTDTITLAIQTNSSGVPSGTPVTNGTATAVDISDTLTTSYAWVTFTFATAPSLTAGTQYHLVLSGAFTVSGTNYVLWGIDNYDVIYPDGSMSVYDGTTWTTEPLYDACFEIYITGGVKGNDNLALFDFNSKNMLLGVFGTSLYKMDKNISGTPDGTFDPIGVVVAWDTYTKLMLHGDGVDGSTTITDEIGKVATVLGNTQIDTAQFKFSTASIYFDGTGDSITFLDSADWAFGTGDFTIDFWARFEVSGAGHTFFSQFVSSSEYTRFHLNNGNTLAFAHESSGNFISFSSSWTPSLATWYHIALVRNGTTFTLYVDGVALVTTTDADSIAEMTAVAEIGSFNATNYFQGWLDEYRVSKGIARWTANFTPPTVAYSASSGILTSSRFWTFADWQSGRALINTDIGLYTYTGTGSATAVSAAPISKFIIVWQNYCLAFGLRGSPNGYKYSDISDYTTWPSANSFVNAFNTNDGDVITGIRLLKGKLYVFKRYSVHRITYLGSNPTFRIDQILGVGSPSHYTIKEVDLGGDLGTVLIFLTTDKKLAIFDGYNVQVVNENLTEENNDLFGSSDDQPLSFADMNYTYTDLFHAVAKTDTSEYILYCVLGSDTSVNYAFVFDWRTGGIFPYDGQIFSSSVYSISTNKVKILYTGGYSGYMWQQESGNSDDGSAINAYWVSGKIKPNNASLINRLLQLALHFKEISSGSTLNLDFQYRLDWNTSWTTVENVNYDRSNDYAFGKTALFDIGTIENMIQTKIKDNSTNPATTLYGIDLYGDPLGVEVGDRATA